MSEVPLYQPYFRRCDYSWLAGGLSETWVVARFRRAGLGEVGRGPVRRPFLTPLSGGDFFLSHPSFGWGIVPSSPLFRVVIFSLFVSSSSLLLSSLELSDTKVYEH